MQEASAINVKATQAVRIIRKPAKRARVWVARKLSVRVKDVFSIMFQDAWRAVAGYYTP